MSSLVSFILGFSGGVLICAFWVRRSLERPRRTQRGGYLRPDVFINMNRRNGIGEPTGEAMPPWITGATRLTSEPGKRIHLRLIRPTPPTLPPDNRPSSPGESGWQTGDDGEEASGLTPPESAA